jgi:hypothetical protein
MDKKKKDKLRSTKHTHKTKDWETRSATKSSISDYSERLFKDASVCYWKIESNFLIDKSLENICFCFLENSALYITLWREIIVLCYL